MIGRTAALLLMMTSAAVANDGAKLFEPCRACHTVDPAVTKPMPGPNLAGLIGRKVGGDPTFDYSPVLEAVRNEGRVWTADALERFIADPEAMFPGTWMSRVAIANAADRAALARFIADPASR